MLRLLFFQNCISPHQMPYIEALSQDDRVDEAVVIVPRITYGDRAQMGWPEQWTQSVGKLRILLKPSDPEVFSLLKSPRIRTVALFSGITAFPEVRHWLDLSLAFSDIERGIITEAPFACGGRFPLWLHKLRFLCKDLRYVKYIKYVCAIGPDAVSYYQRWSKQWTVIPFMYCTRLPEIKDIAASRSALKGEQLKVLFVGSLDARKNVSCLLTALSRVKQPLQLSVVGDGPLKADLESKAKEIKGENKQICFVGAKPMEEVHKIMSVHDILVLPSLHDGWGAVINEAASVGTLTACSMQCGAREISDFTFESVAPLQLAEILTGVAENLIKYRAERPRRRERALMSISPQSVAQRFLNAIF